MYKKQKRSTDSNLGSHVRAVVNSTASQSQGPGFVWALGIPQSKDMLGLEYLAVPIWVWEWMVVFLCWSIMFQLRYVFYFSPVWRVFSSLCGRRVWGEQALSCKIYPLLYSITFPEPSKLQTKTMLCKIKTECSDFQISQIHIFIHKRTQQNTSNVWPEMKNIRSVWLLWQQHISKRLREGLKINSWRKFFMTNYSNRSTTWLE